MIEHNTAHLSDLLAQLSGKCTELREIPQQPPDLVPHLVRINAASFAMLLSQLRAELVRINVLPAPDNFPVATPKKTGRKVPHDPAALESIIERLFAHTGGTKDRLRELVSSVPERHIKAMGEILYESDGQTNAIAFELVKALYDQGIISRKPAPKTKGAGKK